MTSHWWVRQKIFRSDVISTEFWHPICCLPNFLLAGTVMSYMQKQMTWREGDEFPEFQVHCITLVICTYMDGDLWDFRCFLHPLSVQCQCNIVLKYWYYTLLIVMHQSLIKCFCLGYSLFWGHLSKKEVAVQQCCHNVVARSPNL